MNDGDRIEHHRGGIRFLLLSLGVPQGLIGLWALLAPRSFYDDFPVVRDGWVNALGPFDEHLVTDVGALFVGLFVLLAIAAVTLHRTTVVAAAVTWLVFNVPHLVWHSFHLEPYSTVDAVANTVAIAGTVVGGVTILLLARRRAPRSRTASAGGDGARIGLVSDKDAGLMARGTFAYARRQFGVVPEPTRVYAHHPGILAGYGAVEYATERADRVPEKLKALAATKAAALSGCEFCMDIGSMISATNGVTEAQLRALPEHAGSDEFSEVEKLVLDFAVGMTRTPVDVPEELFARLREHFDEAQLVELAHEVALENYRGRFNWAFGIGSQGFTGEGGFCVRPEVLQTA
jgi:alkylhydroperoxidase family enzyme